MPTIFVSHAATLDCILRPIDKEAVFQFNSKYLQLFFATKSDIMCLQQIPQCFLNQHL
jgi:hypothetical protein